MRSTSQSFFFSATLIKYSYFLFSQMLADKIQVCLCETKFQRDAYLSLNYILSLVLQVAREDKLPKKICDDCVYKVELFYQFWNTTANAEKQLLQWLGEVGMDGKQGYVTNTLNQVISLKWNISAIHTGQNKT